MDDPLRPKAVPEPQRATTWRVLVVDDEWMSVAGLCDELGTRGITVDEARTRKGAITMLGRHGYHLVVLDVMLPEHAENDMKHDPPKPEHGIAVLRAIREGMCAGGGTPKDVPVFAITCLDFEVKESLDELKRLGVRKTVTKPVPPLVTAEEIWLCLEEKLGHAG